MTLLGNSFERCASFAQALAAAGGENGYPSFASHDLDPLIHQPGFGAHCLAAVAIAAAQAPRQPVCVIDVGGALGLHHTWARNAFGARYKFDWNVLERPLYVEHARQQQHDPDLHFVSDRSRLPESVDLAYFSGVLQYVERPQDLLCADLTRGAEFIFIARTVFDDEVIPYIQTVTYDDRTIRLAGQVLSRDWLDAHMADFGYELMVSWAEEHYSVGDKARPAPSMVWRKRRRGAS